MKARPLTPAQIYAQIEFTKQAHPQPFSSYPHRLECCNERERLWVNSQGRCYTDVVDDRPCAYFLLYFDGYLAIVEENHHTIFSHLTPELAAAMSHQQPVPQPGNSLTLAELVDLVC